MHGFGQCLMQKFGQIRQIVSWRMLYRLMVLVKKESKEINKDGIPATETMKNKSQFNKIFMGNLIAHINNATPTRELSLFEKVYVKIVKALCRGSQ